MLFIRANVKSISLIRWSQYTVDLSDHSLQSVEIIWEVWEKRAPNTVKIDRDNNGVQGRWDCSFQLHSEHHYCPFSTQEGYMPLEGAPTNMVDILVYICSSV